MTIEQSKFTTGGGAGGAAERAAAEAHSAVLPVVLPNAHNLQIQPSQQHVISLQVGLLAEQPSVRLLKHIVRCYLRLSDNPRAREALRQCLPDLLRSPQFTACLKDDPTTRRCVFCFPSQDLVFAIVEGLCGRVSTCCAPCSSLPASRPIPSLGGASPSHQPSCQHTLVSGISACWSPPAALYRSRAEPEEVPSAQPRNVLETLRGACA